VSGKKPEISFVVRAYLIRESTIVSSTGVLLALVAAQEYAIKCHPTAIKSSADERNFDACVLEIDF